MQQKRPMMPIVAVLMCCAMLAIPLPAQANRDAIVLGNGVETPQDAVKWAKRNLSANPFPKIPSAVKEQDGKVRIFAPAVAVSVYQHAGLNEPFRKWLKAWMKRNELSMWIPPSRLLEPLHYPGSSSDGAGNDTAAAADPATNTEQSADERRDQAQAANTGGTITPSVPPDRDSNRSAQLAKLLNEQERFEAIAENELEKLRQNDEALEQQRQQFEKTLSVLRGDLRTVRQQLENGQANNRQMLEELEKTLASRISRVQRLQERLNKIGERLADVEESTEPKPARDIQVATQLGYGSFYESYRNWFIAGYMMLALALPILVAWIGTVLIRRIAQKAATRHVQQRDQETLRQTAQETAQQEVAPVREQLAAVESEVSGLQTTTAEHGRRIKGAERRLDSAEAHRGLTEVVDRHRTSTQPASSEQQMQNASGAPSHAGTPAGSGAQHGNSVVRTFSFCDGKNVTPAQIHDLKPGDSFDVRLIDHDAGDVELAVTCRVLPRPVDATDTKVEVETVCSLSDKRAAITYVKGGHLKRTISGLLKSGNVDWAAARTNAARPTAA
jgi:uncharacterized coiled-coil protein SlyX